MADAVRAGALRQRYPGRQIAAPIPLLMAVTRPLVIIAVFAPLSVHRYREMSR